MRRFKVVCIGPHVDELFFTIGKVYNAFSYDKQDGIIDKLWPPVIHCTCNNGEHHEITYRYGKCFINLDIWRNEKLDNLGI